jgi:hypothetical protein
VTAGRAIRCGTAPSGVRIARPQAGTGNVAVITSDCPSVLSRAPAFQRYRMFTSGEISYVIQRDIQTDPIELPVA